MCISALRQIFGMLSREKMSVYLQFLTKLVFIFHGKWALNHLKLTSNHVIRPDPQFQSRYLIILHLLKLIRNNLRLATKPNFANISYVERCSHLLSSDMNQLTTSSLMYCRFKGE